MLPLLQFAEDKLEHSLRETIDALADAFALTPEERKQLLPSGRQEVFDNRVGWARTYLSKAGLLKKTRRGHYEISQNGLDALAAKPSRVDVKFLERYGEFREFRALRGTRWGTGTGAEPPDQDQQTTPEEALEFAYSRLRDSLASDIIQQVKAASPSLFERLVVELLLKMGYGGSRQDAGRAIGRSGDERIDGIVNEDRLGLDIIYIQAKRREARVGRPEAQKFVGALQGQRAKSWFQNEAPPQGTHWTSVREGRRERE